MKKVATILFCAAATLGAFAQGTMTFVNNNTWLVSAGGSPLPAGQPATFWFTILTGEPNTSNVLTFLPTDAYATNQNAAGRVFGGAGITVQNWPAGVNRAFVVAGWSANLGTTWNPAWLTGDFGSATTGFFGLSPIVPSAPADGQDGIGVPMNVWGGTYGLTSGFNLEPIPEPTTLALAGLGAAALMLLRGKSEHHRRAVSDARGWVSRAQMNEDSRTPKVRVYGFWFCFCLFFYVLSFGPVYHILSKRQNSFQIGWPKLARVFYFPIIRLSDSNEALGDALSWYLGLWEAK